ncbi:hypothetical protein AZE42_08164 [Rhizopogon vesiculosus]|uniref:Uncharacterized protein n=1 Tax=Rhizopogon vesiculosus TaxID=180088 RepID=A0A1J8R2W2_9AGAM|nr:hypothetical protein AZE42_08164 [Rhizopogon vesiculosus]
MGISVKAAVIVAIIIECILYGVSIFLFGITLWSLTYQRKSTEVSRSMLVAACLLFLLGTMHVIVDANHVWQGFISSGNADQYFDDVSKDTFKNAIYELETLVGDAILIYRCYVVWNRIDVIIIPVIGWMAVAGTGTHAVWSIDQLSSVGAESVFLQETAQWIISFYSTAIATNFIATSYDTSTVPSQIEFANPRNLGILALKLWLIHRRSSGIRTTRSRAYPILVLIMECGALYSISLVTMLATYLAASNGSYIVIDMIGQIIPITFCLIIVRTAMLRFSGETSLSVMRTGISDRLPIARPMNVHIGRLVGVDSDFSKASGVSSTQVDATEDEYHSKLHNYP